MRIAPDSLAFTVLLGAISALPPLSIDMGLPALPEIGQALAVDPSLASLTLTFFVGAFAVAQLVFGPLSDRYGRRPMLLLGCVLYLAASFGCAVAPTITILLACRLAAGAGAAAGTVLGYSIIRDLFQGRDALAKLSYVGLVNGVAPVIAPTLGSLVLAAAGWRAIYGLLAMLGAALIVAVAAGLEESRVFNTDEGSNAASIAGGFGRVLRNPRCVGHTLVGSFSFACLFAYVTGSPLVLIEDMGVSARLFGLLFALTSGGIMAGAALNGWWTKRSTRTGGLLPAGLALLAATSIGIFGLLAGRDQTVLRLMPLLIVNSFAFGLVIPNAVHAVLEPLPDIAGVASSVFGFVQMVCGAVASALVGGLYAVQGPLAMGWVMLSSAVLACLAWGFVARSGTPTLASAAGNPEQEQP